MTLLLHSLAKFMSKDNYFCCFRALDPDSKVQSFKLNTRIVIDKLSDDETITLGLLYSLTQSCT